MKNVIARGAIVLLFVSFFQWGRADELKVIQAEIAFRQPTELGEGAIWHPDRKTLFWVNISGKCLYEWHPETQKNCRWSFDRYVTTVVPETDKTVVVALENEVIRFYLDDARQEHIAWLEADDRGTRLNDGKCDPVGRLWVGSMVTKGTPKRGALYSLDIVDSPVKRIEGIQISNGIAWSADRRWMYYIDTPTQEIRRYAYDVTTGDVRFDGVAVQIPPSMGAPDGMTIDEAGMLWVAHWGGRGVYCWNPVTGELIAKVKVPSQNVTSCAFGGENGDILYITTAAGSDPQTFKEYPNSGSLFSCQPGVKGVRSNFYKAR